jgi:hypothetical protein
MRTRKVHDIVRDSIRDLVKGKRARQSMVQLNVVSPPPKLCKPEALNRVSFSNEGKDAEQGEKGELPPI